MSDKKIESDEKKGFVVNDKRQFGSDETPEEPKATDTETEEFSESEPESETEDESLENFERRLKEEARKLKERGAGQGGFPKINFSTFIISLNSSALLQLGLIEDPLTGKKEKNLPVAKQTIDILGMLQEKTKGNLIGDEEQMLKNILYDLRLMYVREIG